MQYDTNNFVLFVCFFSFIAFYQKTQYNDQDHLWLMKWFSKPQSKKPVRWPEKFVRIPHNGIKSTMSTSYGQPWDPKNRELFSCPVDTPWVIPKAGPQQTFAIPNMYGTEYQTYASGKPISV